MSRITKDIARNVAIKLATPCFNKFKKAKEELHGQLLVIAYSRIPNDIQKAFTEHRKYFNTSSRLILTGNGFNNENIALPKSFPCEGYSKVIALTDSEAKIILPLHRKSEKLHEAHKELRKTLEDTLYSLKTFNKVRDNFAEAYEHLPKPKQEIAIPMVNIRAQLKKYADGK